jgi:hypothetical protein
VNLAQLRQAETQAYGDIAKAKRMLRTAGEWLKVTTPDALEHIMIDQLTKDADEVADELLEIVRQRK